MSIILKATLADNSTSSIEMSENVFGISYNEAVIHQIVVAYMAGARQGTKAQKTRAEVSGGGAKPWKQKGGGRARAGSTRSPIWRTGGVTFAAKNRDYSQKVNRKMYRLGIKSILSELVRQDRLVIRDDIYPELPKTKELKAKLQGLENLKVLIVVDNYDNKLYLAARNLYNIEVMHFSSLNPVSLIRSDKVVMTSSAAKSIQGRLVND